MHRSDLSITADKEETLHAEVVSTGITLANAAIAFIEAHPAIRENPRSTADDLVDAAVYYENAERAFHDYLDEDDDDAFDDYLDQINQKEGTWVLRTIRKALTAIRSRRNPRSTTW